MANFTRLQLRTYQTDTSNFSGPRNFSLENNLSTTAYFNIEGVNGKDIFNSASLSSLVNCSVVTESMHAGFIITPNRERSGFDNVSGSVDHDINGIKDSLTGTFSGSRKYLTAASLLSSFTDVSASVGTYNNVKSFNFNLTASITLDTTESISTISNLTGESASLAIGDIIIFPSESLGATTADGRDAEFTLTETTFTYTGVSASNANVTASLYLIESTSLGTVTVTSQGQEFTTGDTIIFPSQSFGATTADGEDMTFTLKSSDIVSNGTASFVFTPSSTIVKEDVRFIASNTLVYSINDTTASGSAFGVNLDTGGA